MFASFFFPAISGVDPAIWLKYSAYSNRGLLLKDKLSVFKAFFSIRYYGTGSNPPGLNG